jgi:hypothetical protein
MENSTTAIEALYTRQEAAAKLRISLRCLDDLRGLRKLSYIKIQYKVFISESAIVRFIQENTVQCQQQ